MADNEKTRQLEKRVSGTAVSQLSFLQISNQYQIIIEDFCVEGNTRVKMQIYYSLRNASVDDADCDAQLGYCYAYLFDLNKQKFKVIHVRKY